MIVYANGNQKRAGVAILISHKIDFKPKTQMRQRRTLYNHKRVNPTGRYNNINIYAPTSKNLNI